jgi:uncharacterized RDD family membrane protein YckC
MSVGGASLGGSTEAAPGGRVGRGQGWSDLTPHPIRRWIARGFDFYVTTGLVFAVLALPSALASGDVVLKAPAMILLGVYMLTPVRGVATAILNAILLSRFSTTPGKWLCGVRLARKDGARLTFGEAVKRELDVLAMGCGVYIPVLAVVASGFHFFDLRKTGATPWDLRRDLLVEQRPNSPGQIVLALVAFVLATSVVLAIFLAAEAVGEASRARAG